jgi:hypothetical protein
MVSIKHELDLRSRVDFNPSNAVIQLLSDMRRLVLDARRQSKEPVEFRLSAEAVCALLDAFSPGCSLDLARPMSIYGVPFVLKHGLHKFAIELDIAKIETIRSGVAL